MRDAVGIVEIRQDLLATLVIAPAECLETGPQYTIKVD
jgi:hypothetical protein